jgi:thioester reductase-like protein
MVATLLRSRPDAIVYFLGCEEQLSLQHIEDSLGEYSLLNNSWTTEFIASRLRPVSGSLRQRYFGLSKDAFIAPGGDIHAIYHLGSEISLLKTYTDLKAVNIDATLDIIELASRGLFATEIHYLSTWSVLHLQSWASTTFKEPLESSPANYSKIKRTEEPATFFAPEPTLENGYFKARWVAEVLVTRASERGFPVTIYRPSAMTASTKTKACEPASHFTRWMVAQMIRSGSVPELKNSIGGPEFSIDFVPVDFATSAILSISTHPQAQQIMPSKPAIYHLGNPRPILVRELPAEIKSIYKSMGSQTEVKGLVPLPEFIRSVSDALGLEKSAADELSLVAFEQYFNIGHTMFSLDRSNTDRILKFAGNEPKCPPIDSQFLLGMLG